MRVRKTDENGDMRFGRSQEDIWHNVPDGVAQVAQSRLMLFEGEWFMDLDDGTPWNTRVLGKYTGPTRDMVIRARLLGTPSLTSIVAYSSAVNRDTRQFSVQATVDTEFGLDAGRQFDIGAPI